MYIVQHLFSGAYESVPSLLVCKRFLLWLQCVFLAEKQGKITLKCVTFGAKLTSKKKVCVWGSLLWPCGVLTSQSEFCLLHFYLSAGRGFGERYHFYAYTSCACDIFSQRVQGKDWALGTVSSVCMWRKAAGNVCVVVAFCFSPTTFSLLVGSVSRQCSPERVRSEPGGRGGVLTCRPIPLHPLAPWCHFSVERGC